MKIAAWRLFGVAVLALSALSTPVVAQDNYPSSTIRLVVGYAPGGSADGIARQLAQKLSVQMDTNVLVQNKDGAASHIAAELVAKSTPNGYTLFLSTPSQALSPALGEKLGYDHGSCIFGAEGQPGQGAGSRRPQALAAPSRFADLR